MNILKHTLHLSRFKKQIIVFLNDIIISIIISIGVSFYLLEFKEFQNIINLTIIVLVSFSFIPFFVAFGLYRIIFRYYSINSVVNIFVAITFHFLIILTILYFLNFKNIPFEFAIIQIKSSKTAKDAASFYFWGFALLKSHLKSLTIL